MRAPVTVPPKMFFEARLLPPQIAQVAMLLGKKFEGVFTIEDMIKKINQIAWEMKKRLEKS